MNKDLGKTQITPLVRVSSAAIWYEHENRYQVETWVFSDDPFSPSRMFIHGSSHGDILEDEDSLVVRAKTFHRRASNMLLKKFNSK